MNKRRALLSDGHRMSMGSGPFNPRSDGVRIQLYLHKMSVSTAARQGGIFSLFLTDSGGVIIAAYAES
jgi:hypothetical protein